METLLYQLNQLSSELLKQLDHCGLDEMDNYMEKRELIFTHLGNIGPVTADQAAEFRSQVDRITAMDRLIISKMAELRDEANNEINKMNSGKRSKSIYESGSYGDDSLFFDTKQ